MAGAFIAIGACMSALTKNQVIAFVLGAAACFFFLMSGLNMVLSAFRGWAPPRRRRHGRLVQLHHAFRRRSPKVSSTCRTAVFFASLIVVCLIVNTLLTDLTKAA